MEGTVVLLNRPVPPHTVHRKLHHRCGKDALGVMEVISSTNHLVSIAYRRTQLVVACLDKVYPRVNSRNNGRKKLVETNTCEYHL